MDSNPNLIRYACVAHQSGGIGGGSPTIVAEFNSGDSSLQALAHECLLRTPPLHSIFSHTIHSCAYTFVIDDPFIYFVISDHKFPKPNRIWFLNKLKDASQHLIAKHSKSILKSNRSFTPYCFQTQIQPIFQQLMSSNGVETAGIASKTQSKRIFAVPLLAKVGEGLKKKKRLIGDSSSDSKDVLVEDKIELSDQGEVMSREAVVCNQKGAFASDSALCLGDSASGAKQKAKRIWRRHVWVVLVLDFAVCLILFGVWLMVCRGFQCID